MEDVPHDRMKSYDDARFSYTETSVRARRARRIAQRLAILEDSTLARELRERTHERMRELAEEGDDQ